MDMKSVLIFLALWSTSTAYKILILHLHPSYSHQQPVMILTEALVKRGHQVFAVSPNVVPDLGENYTHVDLSFSYSFFSGNVSKDRNEGVNVQKQIRLWEFPETFRKMSEVPSHQFKSEAFIAFQRRVQEEQIEFDVVIGQAHFMPYICVMARQLAAGKPIISVTSLSKELFGEESIGNIIHPSYTPLETPFTDRMSLSQRLYNWVVGTYVWSRLKAIALECARDFYMENYGPEYASQVEGCWSNVSLSLITSNFLYSYPRLLSPNVIELGPLHTRTPKKLPQVLQAWMDGADKGVIYFSFGGNKKSTSLPEDVRLNFIQAFKELPPGHRVLWKWELDGPIPGQSDNILTQKWMPQQSVLAHPKVKVFITHGGLQSFQETVHYGVPTVGIPWFIDQEANVVKMVASGIGAQLLPQDLHSYEKIKAVLQDVLSNKSYAINMKRLSGISRDFTKHAADRAVFWVEHVARHGGASHLRPSIADTTYFEYFCLDIMIVILAILFIVLYAMKLAFKLFISCWFSMSNSKLKEL